MPREKAPADAQRFITMVAQKQGWGVNPDQPFVDDVAAGLATQFNRYGYFLCPCRDGDGERSEDKDIICPCVYARPDMEEHGHCYCGLFLRKGYSGPIRPIPERRGR